MKKRLLIVGIIAVIFMLSGCTKTKKIVEEKGEPVVVCTAKDTFDGIVVETKTTTNFDQDNYVNYQKIESVSTYDNKELYDIYAESIKDAVESAKDSENLEYTYSLDENKMQISTTMIYKSNLFDYSETTEKEKAKYLASYIITNAEKSGEKCEISGVTRKDLGL